MNKTTDNDEIKVLIEGIDDKLDKSVTDLTASIKNTDEKIIKSINDLSNVIADFADQVSNEFIVVKTDIKGIDKKYEHLISTIDGFIGRIDRYEAELAARDNKIDRLERWIEEIAKKVNIKQPA